LENKELFFKMNLTGGAMMFLAPMGGVIALGLAFMLTRRLNRAETGNATMTEIAGYIRAGTRAFLRRQYPIMAIFAIGVFLVLGFALESWLTALCFVFGVVCSAGAGFIGLSAATQANVRTAQAARSSQNKALDIAFSGGAVLGLALCGLGLLGLGFSYWILQDPVIVSGFALGGSFVALFGRVGGGIYAEAVIKGADSVGKTEPDIPEDYPRNPAAIAEQAGDNVSDVAGLGADLFGSYAGSVVAAMTIGAVLFANDVTLGLGVIFIPLVIAAGGVLASVAGAFLLRVGGKSHPLRALNAVSLGAAAIMSVLFYFTVKFFLTPAYSAVFWALLAGLTAGLLLNGSTQYCAYLRHNSAKNIDPAYLSEPATTISDQLRVELLAIALPLLVITGALGSAFFAGGMYGVANAAVGMLATTGIVAAVAAYGPIVANAGGIAAMADLSRRARETTDKLEAAGHTITAMGRSFTLGAAALTAWSLLGAYARVAQFTALDMLQPLAVAGIVLGLLLPFIFCALTINAAGRSARAMAGEICRQFREITGLREGKAKPQYTRCVEITAQSALKALLLPAFTAFLAPLLVGILLGAAALGGMLTGALVSGMGLAILLTDAGSAGDKVKKYLARCLHRSRGSDTHTAGTGDPGKDNSGTSLHILLTLMTIVSLVFAPLFL
jgi:K(+)-stimulated pyrophosphate-energized sodium pump